MNAKLCSYKHYIALKRKKFIKKYIQRRSYLVILNLDNY